MRHGFVCIDHPFRETISTPRQAGEAGDRLSGALSDTKGHLSREEYVVNIGARMDGTAEVDRWN